MHLWEGIGYIVDYGMSSLMLGQIAGFEKPSFVVVPNGLGVCHSLCSGYSNLLTFLYLQKFF